MHVPRELPIPLADPGPTAYLARMKTPDRLRPLLLGGLVDEVVRPLMSGKEASVYIVRTATGPCCAKVYKEAEQRSFHHRALYQEGRVSQDSRSARAMQKSTAFGRQEQERAWQAAEVEALRRLADAGVRVPRPLAFAHGVLLMELVVDAQGDPAPRLVNVSLDEAGASRVHASLIRDVVTMLCAGIVHGDLSEYNVLLAADGPVIIDLPQHVDSALNNNARRLFARDVEHLAAYLGRFAPQLRTTDYAGEIWDLYQQGRLHPETPLTGTFQRREGDSDVAAVLDVIDEARAEAAWRLGLDQVEGHAIKPSRRAGRSSRRQQSRWS